MDPLIYSVLHVAAAFVLVGMTFSAFANPAPERRGFVMMVGGIASLVMVIAGFGLHAKLGIDGFPGWLIVKVVAWLALSAVSGIAFRKPTMIGLLAVISMVAVVAAVYCVYFKPF
ncbi:MAG: hypothetical protein HUU28_00010 [Planctomycetaceae bacterium]|jgi:hypothetical protein|nr:hypothetical protein [Planctomycetaceae bacterium]